MQRIMLYTLGSIMVWQVCFFSLAKAEILTSYLFGEMLTMSITELSSPEKSKLTRGLTITTKNAERATTVFRNNPKSERRERVGLLPGAGASLPQ